LIIVLVVGGVIFLVKKIPPFLFGALLLLSVIGAGMYFVEKKKRQLKERERILIK